MFKPFVPVNAELNVSLKKFQPLPLIVKPYSTKELCIIYGVCPKTFLKWLKPFLQYIGTKNGRFYTVIQVEIIITRLGVPYAYGEA